MKFKVLVTGMGGNVGEGIAKSLFRHYPEATIYGTNTFKPIPGQIYLDDLFILPHASDSNYIKNLVELSSKLSIDIILPSTDLECLIISKNKNSFPAQIVIPVSNYETQLIFNDKYENFINFEKFLIPFCNSSLPSNYSGEFKHIIVKPRDGRGSRDISKNPEQWNSFTDDFIIQEMLNGPELTSAIFYGQNNELIGPFTFQRTLLSGATSTVETCVDYDQQIKDIAKSIKKFLNPTGSINIQSIVSNGKVIPFEINGRLSGTTGLRDLFGFCDVKYTIESYLLKQTPTVKDPKEGSAIRILEEHVFFGKKLNNIRLQR